MVPAVDVPELAIGKTVELTIDGFGERRFTGRIERINPATEPGTRAILVYVGIPNPDGALRGGMFATGRIALAASAPVATLPATAIRTEGGQTYVWTVENGKLVKRGVVTGRRDDAAGRVEVKTDAAASVPVLARPLRQPEGRRAGDRQGAARRRAGIGARRRADVGHDAGRRLTPRPARESSHVDHARLDQQPGLRDDGDGRHRRPGALRVQPAARRADARREPAVRARADELSRRLPRGRRDRRHEAARVRDQHRLRRRA